MTISLGNGIELKGENKGGEVQVEAKQAAQSARPDKYTVIIRVTRSLAEDLPVVKNKYPGKSLGKALCCQLEAELRKARQQGLAGNFEIIDGPNHPID